MSEPSDTEFTVDGIEYGLTGEDWSPTDQTRYFAQKGVRYAFGASAEVAIATLREELAKEKS